MRRIVIILGAVLTSLLTNAQLQVKELKLSNGMTVWLNEDHSQPKVFGAVVVKAGAKDCPNTGIAHYFEHIMFKGTDRMGTIDYKKEKPWLDSISVQYDLLSRTPEPEGKLKKGEVSERTKIQQHINELSLKAADYAIPNEFNRLVSKYGGSGLNAGTGQDLTYYYNQFLPHFIEQWCWLNSERLLTPVFRGFQGELENVYEEKNRSSDGMGDAQDKIFAAIFKTQPYAYPILGSTENLKNPRLSDMASFFKKYYVAPNMGLILCGDITVDDSLTALLEQTFGRLQTGTVPERGQSPMPAIAEGEQYKIKLPIPLIGAEALVFRGATEYEADAVALDLVNKLLYNEKAGLLDSLVNEHKLMMAAAMNIGLNDAAATGVVIIPKLFGKMKKAETSVLEQITKVMAGEFSAEQMEALKQETVMEAQRELETIDKRAQVLIETFSKGKSWADVLAKIESIKTLTPEDVIKAARKYYGAPHLTLTKKYATPDKETLKQPGYQPIAPKNMDAKSAIAQQLEQLPVKPTAIRTVEFERDVTTKSLGEHATMYYKENPMNDIFSFTLRYKDGTLHTPRLAVLAPYLSALGTDSLRKQQLEQAWQKLSVTMGIKADNKTFSISLTGPDSQLEPALRLLSHFLGHVKGDNEALKEAKDADKVERKSFGKQKNDVLKPVLHRVIYGERSGYLRQLSKKEINALKSDELLETFRELQKYDCEVFYCGRRTLEQVATKSRQTINRAFCSCSLCSGSVKASAHGGADADNGHYPQADTYRPLLQYDEPTVFFFNVPKSRQNLVVSYDALAPVPTAAGRATLKLWDEYFGGGMSSVLFQNVREFRSLAYSTSGSSATTSLAKKPNEPLGYITATGTQADKTLEAVATIDSLLRAMPMKEENLDAARQSVLSDIQNAYPTFREVARYVADKRMEGYTTNPDADIARLTPSVSAADVVTFHQTHVAGNKSRVWIIIGDKKLTDMRALSRFGKIVELKKEDVYR